MAYYTFNDRQVYYEIHGTGEPLLLLHGNTTSARLFDKSLDFYKNLYKVIMIDFPGLGRSEKCERFPRDYWLHIANAAMELLDQLEIDKVRIIGTSGGALAGLNIAALRPNLVTHLIADSFFGGSITVEEVEKIVAKRKKAIESNFMFQKYWQFHNGEKWKEVVLEDLAMLTDIAKDNLPIFHADLSNITAKVLGVATTTDGLIDNITDKVAKCISRIPNGETKFYDYGTHTFMITEPEEFNRIAEEFLER
jgi:valacyclovir hydrolase